MLIELTFIIYHAKAFFNLFFNIFIRTRLLFFLFRAKIRKMNKTLAVTGHRILPDDFNVTALYEALEALVKEGYDAFLCGMAEGFDMLCLECLISLRQRYRIVTEACIPFPEQNKRMSAPWKMKYDALLQNCDRKTVLSQNYFSGVFLLRDRYMVDHCDALFAFCEKEKGGAYYTVGYARSKNIPVIMFARP